MGFGHGVRDVQILKKRRSKATIDFLIDRSECQHSLSEMPLLSTLLRSSPSERTHVIPEEWREADADESRRIRIDSGGLCPSILIDSRPPNTKGFGRSIDRRIGSRRVSMGSSAAVVVLVWSGRCQSRRACVQPASLNSPHLHTTPTIGAGAAPSARQTAHDEGAGTGSGVVRPDFGAGRGVRRWF